MRRTDYHGLLLGSLVLRRFNSSIICLQKKELRKDQNTTLNLCNSYIDLQIQTLSNPQTLICKHKGAIPVLTSSSGKFYSKEKMKFERIRDYLHQIASLYRFLSFTSYQKLFIVISVIYKSYFLFGFFLFFLNKTRKQKIENRKETLISF